MALIHAIHILAHGDKTEASHIAEDIQRHQRLLVGGGAWSGTGVYGWYPEQLPDYWRDKPQVLFEIDDQEIVPIRTWIPGQGWRNYFRIPGAIGEYVSIRVLALMNLD